MNLATKTHSPPNETQEINEIGPDNKQLSVGSSTNFAEVLPGELLFGNVKMAQNWEELQSAGVEAVVNLINYEGSSKVPMFSDRLSLYHCPIDDLPLTGIDWIEPPAQFIDEQVRLGKKVYVHCSQGISRATTLVLYYLMTRHSFSLKEAFAFLRSVRPVVCPSIGFISGLGEFEALKTGKKPSLSKEEYSEACVLDVFPSLTEEEVSLVFQTARSHIETDVSVVDGIIEQAGSPNIEPVGYLVIEMLLERFPSGFVQRKGCTKHHPFD